MRVLELGSYVVPSFAGMILAEQGHQVLKWWTGEDPILGLHRGQELWDWLQHGKQLAEGHARLVAGVPVGVFEGVIDNIRASTWARWGVDPAAEADRLGIPWVSMRAEVGERSFDAVAQAQSWGEYGVRCPFYVGDTVGGLWMAFKLLAQAGRAGHHVLYQATCMEKLVEGELGIDVRRWQTRTPWDPVGTYELTSDGAAVEYKGERVTEPVRDRAWKLAHMRHEAGRLTI